jgi:hypothetical protein
MLRRFPYLRTLATVCILSLTVQVAAPLFASPGTRGGGKKKRIVGAWLAPAHSHSSVRVGLLILRGCSG